MFGLSQDPPEAAAQLAVCSLAAALDLTEPGPWPGPYLSAPSASDLPLAAGKRYRVAVVWAGNPAHINDAHRSLALGDLAPLLARTDIAQPLLSPIYYIRRALAPFADVREAHGEVADPILSLLAEKPSALVLADSPPVVRSHRFCRNSVSSSW